MKRLLSILIFALLCFSFVACGSNDDNSTNDPSCPHIYNAATCTEPQKCTQCGATNGSALGHSYGPATCTEPQKCTICGETNGTALGHSYSPATCTEPQKCTICGEIQGTALGHSTSSGTCTRCGVFISSWKKTYYTDEFNNPTDNAFIAPIDTLSGTFSNSATTNSKLSAYVRVNIDDCEIMLWEYGSSLVKASSTTDYNITLLLPDGTKKYFTGTMYKNGFAICLDDYDGIISLLKNTDGVIRFYIKENSKYGVNSTYLFDVNTSGFKNLYNETFN